MDEKKKSIDDLLSDLGVLEEAPVGVELKEAGKASPTQKGPKEVLESFLEALPASEADRPEYHAFRARLSGHGHLALRRPPQEGEYNVWVRRLMRGELEPRWRQLPLDGQLQVGQYLVKEVEARSQPIVQAVTIQAKRRLPMRRAKLVGGVSPFWRKREPITRSTSPAR